MGEERIGLVRQANWQKVGGASPPERRSEPNHVSPRAVRWLTVRGHGDSVGSGMDWAGLLSTVKAMVREVPRLSDRMRKCNDRRRSFCVRCRRAPRCQRTHAQFARLLLGPSGGLQTAPVVVKGPRREWRKPKPMMNGLKKSDEAVRPVRAFELRERELLRTRSEESGPQKGNPDCQSTAPNPVSGKRATAPGRPGYGKLQRETRRNVSLRSSTTLRRIALGAAYVRIRRSAPAAAGV